MSILQLTLGVLVLRRIGAPFPHGRTQPLSFSRGNEAVEAMTRAHRADNSDDVFGIMVFDELVNKFEMKVRACG